MFGPNYQHQQLQQTEFCHRSKRFTSLIEAVRFRFQTVFQLKDWDIVFLAGPGTLGMQTVLHSLTEPLPPNPTYPYRLLLIDGPGRFNDRWRQMTLNRCQYPCNERLRLECLLETSISGYPNLKGNELMVVDAISGFPFYPLPERARIFVTTSGKQLGAPPGVCIVGVRKDSWGLLKPSPAGYDLLSLAQHFARGPLTTLPPLVFEHLHDNLRHEFFDAQSDQINRLAAKFDAALPADATIGFRRCPVITVKAEEIGELAGQFELYPQNKPTDRHHIFLYSQPEADYEPLIKAIHEAREL